MPGGRRCGAVCLGRAARRPGPRVGAGRRRGGRRGRGRRSWSRRRGWPLPQRRDGRVRSRCAPPPATDGARPGRGRRRVPPRVVTGVVERPAGRARTAHSPRPTRAASGEVPRRRGGEQSPPGRRQQ
ncbi:hypothetical protein F3K43_09810 [Streptomyces sp. LBUM 1476]|nr:hypothetical protein [Streptomyces sp. LBUM 1476]